MRATQQIISSTTVRRLAVGAVVCWPLAVGGIAAAADYPVTSGTLTSSVSGSNTSALHAGSTVHVGGGGFAPGSTVTLTLHSTPVILGTTTASASGWISADVVLPAGTVNGTHSIQAAGAAPGGGTTLLSEQVTVTGGTAVPVNSGSLAFTGADVGVISLIGLGALAAGSGALLVARRSRAQA